MEYQLKKCPFCGGDAYLYVNSGGVRVRCENCECQTPTYYDGNVLTWPDKLSVDTVVAIWNRRANEDSGTTER